MDDRDISVVSGGGDIIGDLFHNIVSISNLLRAWNEFKRGKLKKKDVGPFEWYLENHIFKLHEDLVNKTYSHNPYEDFYVSDPKRRHIHKASVRDRVVHQAVYQILYPIFDRHFIYDSYSSRHNRGTHLGVERAYSACRKVSKNWTVKTYVLKCDIRKFFDSIDHIILRSLIEKSVACQDTMNLIDILFISFEKKPGKGLPLGNVTSQLFANIYFNEFDQFIKNVLKIKYYFRYCDDFIIIHTDRNFLVELIEKIGYFLHTELALDLHPKKVEIKPLNQGIDFLGYVIVPHMIVLRTRTKKRVIKKIRNSYEKLSTRHMSVTTFRSICTSYLGVLSHCRNKKLERYIKHFLSSPPPTQ